MILDQKLKLIHKKFQTIKINNIGFKKKFSVTFRGFVINSLRMIPRIIALKDSRFKDLNFGSPNLLEQCQRQPKKLKLAKLH